MFSLHFLQILHGNSSVFNIYLRENLVFQNKCRTISMKNRQTSPPPGHEFQVLKSAFNKSLSFKF